MGWRCGKGLDKSRESIISFMREIVDPHTHDSNPGSSDETNTLPEPLLGQGADWESFMDETSARFKEYTIRDYAAKYQLPKGTSADQLADFLVEIGRADGDPGLFPLILEIVGAKKRARDAEAKRVKLQEDLTRTLLGLIGKPLL